MGHMLLYSPYFADARDAGIIKPTALLIGWCVQHIGEVQELLWNRPELGPVMFHGQDDGVHAWVSFARTEAILETLRVDPSQRPATPPDNQFLRLEICNPVIVVRQAENKHTPQAPGLHQPLGPSTFIPIICA